MSVTTDKDHFFQTSSSLEQDTRRAAKSSNKSGNPIPVGSKILDIIPDPTSEDHVFIAESAGIARRVQLSSNEKGKHTYRGHTAPVTSLALSHTSTTLYTGSWDKSVLAFDVSSRQIVKRFLGGHTDFVKCLVFLSPRGGGEGGKEGLLCSGSSDSTIIVWDCASGAKLHSLSGHARGVVSLVLDPFPPAANPASYTILSGGSEREIRTWLVSNSSAREDPDSPPLHVHETSVYKLRFSPLASGSEDLWTASADGTAMRISIRTEERASEDTLPHPNFVNDVVICGGIDTHAPGDTAGDSREEGEGLWVVTACRDENLRVWDRGSGKLVCLLEGHFDEVTGLAVVGRGGWTVVSVGIDGTVRTWGVKPAEVNAVLEEAKRKEEMGGLGEEEKNPNVGGGLGLLTEEEERELAELMEDDD